MRQEDHRVQVNREDRVGQLDRADLRRPVDLVSRAPRAWDPSFQAVQADL